MATIESARSQAGAAPPSQDSCGAAEELQDRFKYDQELKRGLSVWHIAGTGINYMNPLGGALLVGIIMVTTGGNATLPYILGMVALLIFAGAYAALVPRFPLAGSAYSYVSKGLNPHVGFLTGWVLMLTYVLLPAVGMYLAATYLSDLLPWLPLSGSVLLLSAICVVLNIFGVDLLAKSGLWMLAFVCAIWAVLCVGWMQYLISQYGVGSLFSFSAAFHFSTGSALATAVSLTLVNIIGFDALTTFVEEARNPKKDVPWAMYMAIIGGCFFFIVSGYLCSLVLSAGAGSDYLSDPDLAAVPFSQAAIKAQGTWLATLNTIGLAASVGIVFVSVATGVASRLWYGMGRDRLLPKHIFGAVNKRFQTPHWNILIVTGITIAIVLFADMNRIFNYVVLGALMAFAVVQVTAIWQFVIKPKDIRRGIVFYVRYLLWPLTALAVLVWLLSGIPVTSLLFALGFLAVGFVWLLIATRGLRKLPPELEM